MHESEDRRRVVGRQREVEGRAVAERPHVVVGGGEDAQERGRRPLRHVQDFRRQEARRAVVDVRDGDGEGRRGGEGGDAAVLGDDLGDAYAPVGRLAVQGATQPHAPARVDREGAPAAHHAVLHLLIAAL